MDRQLKITINRLKFRLASHQQTARNLTHPAFQLVTPTKLTLVLSKKSWYKRSSTAQAGQGFIELALCIPLMIVFILGIVTVGMAITYKLEITSIAHEAARAIAKSTNDNAASEGVSSAQTLAAHYALTSSSSSSTTSNLNVEISGVSDGAPPVRGQVVTVSVQYHTQLFGFFSVDITARASDVVDCWRSRDSSGGGSCVPPAEQN